MHLSISEQCSIDQPRGIRQAVELLTHRRNSLHAVHHEAIDCLGKMIWETQRAGRPPDGDAYIECVQQHATPDSIWIKLGRVGQQKIMSGIFTPMVTYANEVDITY